MKTLEEIKVAAATLPPRQQYDLAQTLLDGDAVRVMQRRELIEALMVGVRQAERGELHDADTVFADLHQRVAAKKRP